MEMKIVNIDANRLGAYICTQISNLFPTGVDPELALIDVYLQTAIGRLEQCVSQVRMWIPGQFDVLHSSQYCIFLYYLSNSIWREEQARSVCTKLFLLNKALNGIDCFYEIELPEVFFIGHSVGIVLAKATYGNKLVLYQNSTVGKNHGVSPVLGDGVIMYPNTAIIGNCRIGPFTILSQGTSVINTDCIGNAIIFNTSGAKIATKSIKRNPLFDIFR
jgi:serine O-acetyltransferase